MQEQGPLLKHKSGKLLSLLSLFHGIEVFGFQACLLLEWAVQYPALHGGNTITMSAIWPCNYLPSDLEGKLPYFLYAKKGFLLSAYKRLNFITL